MSSSGSASASSNRRTRRRPATSTTKCAPYFFFRNAITLSHIRLSLSQNIHRQQLRAYTKQQQNQIAALERRVAELEQAARDADERTRQMADEKARVENELKTTQRDLSKLDSFKRSILQSIQDEELPGAGLGGLSAAGLGGDFTPAVPPSSSASAFRESMANPMASALVGRTPSMPTSPAPPVNVSSATPALPTGGGGSPTGGEGGNAAAVMDGKDFFRQARLRLTYEQFNQFLTNIKRLNDHAQTRDETLARAQEIFGSENGDLFVSFKTLLSKHGLT